MSTRQRFTGKVALLTGASGGIGSAVARRLIEEGAHVLLTGRSAERGEALVETLGVRAAFVTQDLHEPSAADRLVEAALAAHGKLDVLVNNAGLDHTDDLLSTPLEDAREIFEVNFFAALGALQAAGRAMAAGSGGSIVNVTSRLASVGVAKMGVYGASKGALLAITRAAAIELAPLGIRVNAVAPGFTRTPLYQDWLERQDQPHAAEAAAAAAIPQRRLAEPEDVAAAIAFLASDDALHVTGASLAVDGGYTAA